ncbi:membrane protein [Bacillus sp. FJAT-27231]|uniref:cytochrome c oxidase assembly protein n=1 Tax=Bacillus sp. FJAT-27231 TaxID=1679168 RepID=UPI000670FC2A|nr:cytochrome c oxidase assembly protein [Bacillus sp. FJAT-27231]KMY52941.1 membrane protein [Bacillus sp. FJAT-27231]
MSSYADICYTGGQLSGVIPQVLLALPFGLALFCYLFAVIRSNRHYKKWPLARTVFWIVGVLFAVFSVAGPLAERARFDFTAHMIGHLFLGMAAPLFMALAAPMTLILRVLPIHLARCLTRLLKSVPVRFVSDPIVASLLNVGGLWILYTTGLYTAMHQSLLLHLFVHVHVFLAGYVFTISLIYIDPIPHRKGFLYRSIVLIVTFAGHGILSKYIYAHPPAGVSLAQAEKGGMIMYYGGDAIDLVFIFILCMHWYKSTRPRELAEKKVSGAIPLAARR